MKTKTLATTDTHYDLLERQVATAIGSLTGPLFRTEPESLADAYLEGIPENRQHYNCHCCRHFIDRAFSLVKIDEQGDMTTPVIDAIIMGDNKFFMASADNMRMQVRGCRVIGTYAHDGKPWGVAQTGEWTHLHGNPSQIKQQTSAIATQNQIEAARREEFKLIVATVGEFSVAVAEQAVRILSADVLNQSEKHLGVAKWFLDFRRKMDEIRDSRRKRNLTWLTVATAPVGFAHIKNSVVGTLLTEIKGGQAGFEEMRSRFNEKVHPLQYKRPITPPSGGTVKQAEELVAKLGVASAFQRRYARVEEVVAYWRTVPVALPTTPLDRERGLFGHLKTGGATPVVPVELPATTMTWDRFRKEVLPLAKKLEMLVPTSGPFFGFVTAVHADAKPILQWDREDQRNPMSWFFENPRGFAAAWSLTPGSWTEVMAVCEKPPMWTDREFFKKEGEAAHLILKGAWRANEGTGGLFFPDCMKSEFHGIRSVIEAFSKTGTVEGRELGTANGYAIQEHDKTSRVRLKVDGDRQYVIDRWN